MGDDSGGHRVAQGAQLYLPVRPITDHGVRLLGPVDAGSEEFMPRRQEATDKERDWQGCCFRVGRKRWRVLEKDGVVYDPDFELSLGRWGCLVVAHYDVGKFGDAAPGDAAHKDVEITSLDVFASFFEDGGGAVWD